jgi:23S rRNA pseudouridine955/2504/2580 synthase
MQMNNKWIVDSQNEGARLLTYVKKNLNGLFTTGDIEWAIEHNHCTVNGKVERFCSTKLKSKDTVVIHLAKKPHFVFEKTRVLYEDPLILAYNKPHNLASTGDKGLEGVLSCKAVHRLDRDTTGVILLAKLERAAPLFEDLFRKREIKKTYLAVVWGHPPQEGGIIENYLGKIAQRQGEVTWGVVPKQKGLFAKTEWQVEKRMKEYTLVRCTPLTGRTHQIRIHLRAIGHPIVGDLHYGGRAKQSMATRPLLHAHALEFMHPQESKLIEIVCPPPQDFI